jgi:hypothetical protein
MEIAMVAPLRNLISFPGRKNRPMRRLPSDEDLNAIPLMQPGVFELSDAETKKLRARLYALNKDNVRWKFGSRRYAPLTLVWRMEI